MSNAQHTPGPWQARSEYEPWLIIGNVDGEILHDGPSFSYTEICEVIGGDDAREALANARLIAAAPDLLALAIQYRDDLKRPPNGDSVERRLAAVEAGVARATGEA